MENSIKKENGITLIVLAITVIVLIILSTITINAIVGKNGLITQGKKIRGEVANELEEGNNKINSLQEEQGYYEGGIVDVEDDTEPTLNNLKVSDVTVSSFKISVNVSDEQSGIARIEYKIDELEDGYKQDSVNPQAKNYTFTGLEEGTTYTARVKITDKNGNIKEETVIQKTKEIPVPTITNVTIGNVTYDAMTITVTANSDEEFPISQYEYSADGGTTFTKSTSKSYTFSGLAFGKSYNIVVRVSNTGKKSVTSASKAQSTTIPSTSNFSYTGNYQTYTVPATGKYKLEVWGAQGGYRTDSTKGGRGRLFMWNSYSNKKYKNIYLCWRTRRKRKFKLRFC